MIKSMNLYLNNSMFEVIETICNMIYTTFNEEDHIHIINMIKDCLDIEDLNYESDSESNVWTDSEEEYELELVEYLRNY